MCGVKKILKEDHQSINMDIAKKITELREEAGENRKDFSVHTGIPVRTLEDWEAGRRTPPEYIPRLIEYQMKYEELLKSMRNMQDTTIKERDSGCHFRSSEMI